MKWFNVTESAQKQIANLLEKNPGKWAVSLSVIGGGCAGFKYDWGFLDSSVWSGGRSGLLLRGVLSWFQVA